MLTRQLRELEKDRLITRKIYAEIPPLVEYFISEKGETIMPILEAMFEWGQKNIIFGDKGEIKF
jgi:DNA-binding HxlR family transcriptional regulator